MRSLSRPDAGAEVDARVVGAARRVDRIGGRAVGVEARRDVGVRLHRLLDGGADRIGRLGGGLQRGQQQGGRAGGGKGLGWHGLRVV
jgi:hypothetical protein